MTGTNPTDARDIVRALRSHYGLSQAALAQLLDVTRVTVANWERGFPMSRVTRYALLHLDYRLGEQLTPTDPLEHAED